MPAGSWVVGAFINFQTNGVGVMGRLASATRMTNAQIAQMHGTLSAGQVRMMRYQQQLESIRTKQLQFAATTAAVGSAIGFSYLAKATNDAAKLERAMTGVQLATAASGDEYAALQRQIMSVSGQTAQSAVTIAQEMQRAAQVAALKDPAALMKVFPMMAKFADVRWMASGGQENPVETVGNMASFAHLFQAYKPEQLAAMFDQTAKLMAVTHQSLNTLVRQGGYFIPTATSLGVSLNTVMDWLGIASQTGLIKGRGGTGLQDFVMGVENRPQTTSQMTANQRKGMRGLQMFDQAGYNKFLDVHGKLMADKAMEHLNAMMHYFEKTQPRMGKATFANYVEDAFGKQGGRIVFQLAQDATLNQMHQNRANMNKASGVAGQFDQYQKDFFIQWNRFTTNLTNFGIALVKPVLPNITAALKNMAEMVSGVTDFLLAHPAVAAGISEAIAGISSILGAFASFAGLKLAGMALGAAGIDFGAIAASIGALFAGPVGWVGIGLAIVSGIGILLANPQLQTAMMRAWDDFAPKLSYTMGYGIGMVTKMLLDGIHALFGVLESAGANLAKQLQDSAKDPRFYYAMTQGPAGVARYLSGKSTKAFGDAWQQYATQSEGTSFGAGFGAGANGGPFSPPTTTHGYRSGLTPDEQFARNYEGWKPTPGTGQGNQAIHIENLHLEVAPGQKPGDAFQSFIDALRNPGTVTSLGSGARSTSFGPPAPSSGPMH